MIRGLSNMMARHLCLIFVVSAILASAFNDESTIRRAETSNLYAPTSVLLHMLQTKHAVIRSLRLDQNDEHPMDEHPTVQRASLSPDYIKAARFPLVGRSNHEPSRIGWKARAPPISITPTKL